MRNAASGQPAEAPFARGAGRPLTEADAIDLWIARWLRARRADLCRRYVCDPRRLYEIWEGVRFPASRDKAWAAFRLRYPALVERVDSGPHRRIPRSADPRQLSLFPETGSPGVPP